MPSYTVYDAVTGRVKRTGQCQRSVVLKQHGDNEKVYMGTFPSTQYYFLNDEPVEKAPLPCTLDKTSISANGVDEATLSGIPLGSTAWVSGFPSEEVNDGEVVVTTEVPSTIIIEISHDHYITQSWVVEAV